MKSEDSRESGDSGHCTEQDMFDLVPKRKRISTGREDPRSRLNSKTRVKGRGQLEGQLVGETAFVNKSLSSWEGPQR